MGSDGYVTDLGAIASGQEAAVGGKAAGLGALMRVPGVRVPPGFCVTTAAFGRARSGLPQLERLLGRPAALDAGDREAIAAVGAACRRAVAGVALPRGVAEAVAAAVAGLGDGTALAVRSSASAEDGPSASFAGQHASFLGVVGAEAVLDHVRRVWASLYSDAAIAYRARAGVDERSAQMAVVVQRLVLPRAAGVLFTADPASSDRATAVVEAVRGSAEDLVAGRAPADAYRVRGGAVAERTLAGADAVLDDTEAVALAALGRRIEVALGGPQDIEWCLADDGVHVVQSRPITTLFPLPEQDDATLRVYVSTGHQQMMTDPMRPLGISLWQLTALPRMHEAGGRLFVDVAPLLAAPGHRAGIVRALGTSDPLIGDALQTLLDRGDLRLPPPAAAPPRVLEPTVMLDADPGIVAELVKHAEVANAALEGALRPLTGPALVDAVIADVQELRAVLFDPRSRQVYMTAMDASAWLDEHLERWLGVRRASDALTKAAPGNVTSEMGLALLDVADVVRPFPEVIAHLRQAPEDGFLDGLAGCAGGRRARAAITAFLTRYGMRCVGEIDVTRPRWGERPALLAPLILANVHGAAPGAAARRTAEGRREAAVTAEGLLTRLRALPGGAPKAAEAEQMIARVRTFIGYREYPKYALVARYFAYKRALMAEAGRLAAAGVLREPEDCFFLTLPELRAAAAARVADHGLIDRRRAAFAASAALTPPRVMTSDGEVPAGSYRRDDVPAGALVGLPVSSGVVEGRARVVHDVAGADLQRGDILVTTFTDPSWCPAFVVAAGLVTEVGGLMTHGAVVAREYGLPAVVGVEHATRRIRDGERIRVDGAAGHVELLDRAVAG